MDMHPAEHLPWHVDAIGLAAQDTIERRTPGPIDAGQPKHPRAQCQPCLIGLAACGTAAMADGRVFIDPGTAAIAIDAGRGQIADPAARRRPIGQRRRIGRQHRIATFARRHRGEDMRRRADCRGHCIAVTECERAVTPVARGAGHLPAQRAQLRRQPRGGVAQPQDQQPRHTARRRYLAPMPL